MDLINRYVGAVKQFLPKGQQQDISRELSESLHEQMDDRAAELGRPLTEAEQAAILKALGHPVLIAGRYQNTHHSLSFGPQLIGPVLFPLYFRILVIVLPLAFGAGLLAMRLAGSEVSEAVPGLYGNAWVQFVIITAIFTAAQQHLNRNPDAWDPTDPLSPVPLPADPRWVSRFDSLVQIVILTIGLLWLRSLRGLTLPAELGLTITPLWTTVYWMLMGLTAATLVQPIVNFLQPRWVLFHTLASLVTGTLWIALLVYVLTAGPWVTGHLADRVNPSIALALQITLLISAVTTVWEARPLLRPLLRRLRR